MDVIWILAENYLGTICQCTFIALLKRFNCLIYYFNSFVIAFQSYMTQLKRSSFLYSWDPEIEGAASRVVFMNCRHSNKTTMQIRSTRIVEDFVSMSQTKNLYSIINTQVSNMRTFFLVNMWAKTTVSHEANHFVLSCLMFLFVFCIEARKPRIWSIIKHALNECRTNKFATAKIQIFTLSIEKLKPWISFMVTCLATSSQITCWSILIPRYLIDFWANIVCPTHFTAK